MASVRTCMLFLTMVHISAGIDTFVKVDCQSESHGQYGQDSILKCVINTTEEATDAVIKVVTWKKDEKLLAVFGNPQPNEPRFSFSEQNFNRNTRDVSLIVSNTQIKDSGEYECMVWTDRGRDQSQINLAVTAKYSAPIVSSIPEKEIPHNTEVTLVCNAEGGYPEGRIHWFDQEKKEWTSSSRQEAKQMDDERFNLTSKLTLLKNSVFSHYICSVYNTKGGEDGEMKFDLPFKDASAGYAGGAGAVSKIVAPVLVIGSLIVGLLMALLFKKIRPWHGNGGHTSLDQDEMQT